MSKGTILIAEDEGIVSDDLKSILEQLGYTVPDIAVTGEEVVEKALKIKPDLLLIDVVLKGKIDGIEAAKQIYQTLNIPIVYVTAYSDKKTLARAKETEPYGYIIKPYNERDLGITIEIALLHYKPSIKMLEQKCRNFLEVVPDPIIISSKEAIILANRRTEEVFGYTWSEMIGNPIEMLLPERFRNAHTGHRETYYANPSVRPMGAWRELFARRKDGTEIPVSINLAPMEVREGLYVISVIRDTTETRRTEAELALLQDIAHDIVRAKDFSAALEVVLRKVCEKTGWLMGEAWVPSPDGSRLECSPAWYCNNCDLKKFREASKEFTFLPGIGLPGRVWSSKKSAWIPDVIKDENFLRLEIAKKMGIKACVAIPVMAQDQVVAVMDFFVSAEKKEDGRFIKLVSSVSAQLGIFIQEKFAEDSLKAKTEQLEAVSNAMTLFLEDRDWKQASSLILRCALAQTESEYGFIGVVVEGGVLRILSYEGIVWDKTINRGFYEDSLRTYQQTGYLEFTNLDNLFGSVITGMKVVISNAPASDQRSGGRIPPGHPPLLSFLGVPIFGEKGIVGIIGVANRPGGYRFEEQGKIEILCQTTSVLYESYRQHEKEILFEAERKQSEERINYLAYHDLLTGLPNRLMLHDKIEEAISNGKKKDTSFALLILDLDHFGDINDTLGHHQGDAVLVSIAERLKNIFTDTGTVSRLGGDDFTVILPGVDVETVSRFVDKITKSLDEPFLIGDIPINTTAGIGVSFFPGHGENTHTLLRRADIALHEARKQGINWAIYSPEYDRFSSGNLALIGELRHAIDSNQLFLHYQPKIDLKTSKAIGAEALVRWQHPTKGVIPPDQFISLAEHSGLIKQLTKWVLTDALRQSISWREAGLEVSIAVNLSLKDLRTPLLLDQISGLLSTWGVDPRRLRFEITESLMMIDPKLTIEILTQLALTGICFSIDDFGTGYSSLKYLQTLPVDEIKIDKSFVLKMTTDEGSMKIVKSTIELAHSLGMNVTAEGVENQETFDKLTTLGCDAAQGYFISRPIPPVEFAVWLGKQG